MLANSLFLQDMRIRGVTPVGRFTEKKYVAEGDPIERVLATVMAARVGHGPLRQLTIFAHGIEDNASRGGYGIALGADGINLDNVPRWAYARGSVDRIVLISCAVADVAPGSYGKKGDGRLLCSRLAVASGAYVKASINTQYYSLSADDEINIGTWVGLTLTYAPDGTLDAAGWGGRGDE